MNHLQSECESHGLIYEGGDLESFVIKVAFKYGADLRTSLEGHPQEEIDLLYDTIKKSRLEHDEISLRQAVLGVTDHLRHIKESSQQPMTISERDIYEARQAGNVYCRVLLEESSFDPLTVLSFINLNLKFP